MTRRLWPTLILLAACAGPSETELADFYDWLKYRREAFVTAVREQDWTRYAEISQRIQNAAEPRVESMIRDVENPDIERRKLAVFGLGFVPVIPARDALLGLLEDENPLIRAGSLASLGLQRLKSTPADRIAAMAEDSDARVRQASMYSLWNLLKEKEDRGTLSAITARLSDPVDEVRSEAYVVLRRLGLPSTVPVIAKKGLNDNFLVARMNAAVALGSMKAGAWDAIPDLVQSLRDHEHKVVIAVWHALRNISGQDINEWSYEAWRSWWEEDEKLHHYVCPKHFSVHNDRPGTCTEQGCLLDLKRTLKGAEESEAKVVTGDYACPSHPSVRGTVEFICPKCGDRVVKIESPEKKEEPEKKE